MASTEKQSESCIYSSNAVNEYNSVLDETNIDSDAVRTLKGDISTDGTEELDNDIFMEKSFGVLREELMMAANTNNWQKGAFYFSIFIGMFVALMESAVVTVFASYATNDYKQHSLMSTVGIIRNVVSAASLPIYARASDTFGRLEVFVFSTVLRVIGLVVMSQATTINKYAGGIVLYGLGFTGARALWQFNLADASSLRYRFLTAAVLHLPNIIITWASGSIVSGLLHRYKWNFGIALWAFTFPLACIPYLALSFRMRWIASRTESWAHLRNEERKSYLGMNESTHKYEENIRNGNRNWSVKAKVFLIRTGYISKALFWKVDLVGCLFVVLICGLILVPLTLAGGVLTKWSRASTIAPLVIGFVTIPFFIVWERKLARFPLIPFPLLADRGIWAAFVIAILYTFVSGMPSTYAYPVLLVGMNATETVATRITQLEGFVTSLTIPIFGLVLAYYRRSKGFVILGVCVWFIAMGLFVHFRGDNDGIRGKYYRDGVAVGMCLMGFGVAFIARLVVVSAQACTNHEYTALIIAVFASLYSIGSAFSKCVTGAIWTQKMYSTIVQKMIQLDVDPELAKAAYQSPYTFIKTHDWGTPARVAVVLAYADIQRKMCITGLCLCVPTLIIAFCLRDHYLVSTQSLEQDTDRGFKGGNKSQILYKNDDDVILKYVRKCFRK